MTRKHYHGHKLYILPLPRKSKRKKRSVQPNVKIRTDPLLLARLFLPSFLSSFPSSLPFPPIFSKSSPLPSPNTSNSSCNSNVFHQEERWKERREGRGREREREAAAPRCTATPFRSRIDSRLCSYDGDELWPTEKEREPGKGVT